MEIRENVSISMGRSNGVGEKIHALDQGQAIQCAHNDIGRRRFNAANRSTVSSIFFFVHVMLHYHLYKKTSTFYIIRNRHRVCANAFATASICGMTRMIVVKMLKGIQHGNVERKLKRHK